MPDQNAAREWYMKTFGGVEAQRRPGLKGVGIPPGTVDFLGVGGRGGKDKDGAPPLRRLLRPAPKGRFLDHIGFEVKDLDAFAKKLEGGRRQVRFMAPRDMTKQFGLKIAFITDPFGTYIELTEGLSKQ